MNKQLKLSQVIKKEIFAIFSKNSIFCPVFEKIVFIILDVKIDSNLKLINVTLNSIDKKLNIDILKIFNILKPQYQKQFANKIKVKFLPCIKFNITN